MKTDERLHEHPRPSFPSSGKYTHIYGSVLEPGDTLEATDVYNSSNGYWEQCPCPGATLGEGITVKWVRPVRSEQKHEPSLVDRGGGCLICSGCEKCVSHFGHARTCTHL